MPIHEQAMLALRGVRAGADVAAQVGDLTEHEAGEVEAAAISAGGRVMAEGVNAGTVGVARHTQVPGVAEVGAKLELVVASEFRYVSDPLELAFTLDQWAVATRNTQAVAEVRSGAYSISNSPKPEVKLSPKFAFGMPKAVIAALPASGLLVSGLYWK